MKTLRGRSGIEIRAMGLAEVVRILRRSAGLRRASVPGPCTQLRVPTARRGV